MVGIRWFMRGLGREELGVMTSDRSPLTVRLELLRSLRGGELLIRGCAFLVVRFLSTGNGVLSESELMVIVGARLFPFEGGTAGSCCVGPLESI